MRNPVKMLGGLALAAVLGAVLLGLSGPGGASSPAHAQQFPPSRFAGSVTLDGQPVANGTVIEAKIGSTNCADPVVTFTESGQARYVIDVKASGEQAGCGTSGSVISFFVGGKLAQQTGSWNNTQLQVLNLTAVSGSPTAVATATTAAGATATPTRTPAPPSTGGGASSDSGTSAGMWLLAALGLGALALGAGGVAVAARRAR